MRVGLIAEGTTDQAVIANILKGLGIDASSIIPIRPNLRSDEIDKNYENPFSIGTWQGVKNDCLERIEFEKFYTIEDNKYIIIQIDTAEANHADFNVIKPEKQSNPNYSSELRNLVIEKINEWLDNNYSDKLLYAITIEEMEAWLLTIFNTQDTIKSANPKNKLFNELRRKNIDKRGCRNDGEYYSKISKEFGNKKKLLIYAEYNQSMKDFIESIKQILVNE